MTMTVRNNMILGGIGIIVLLTAIYLVSIVAAFGGSPPALSEGLGDAALTPIVIALFAELVFCLSLVSVLFFAFRKTTSPEIFLYIVFVTTMAFDALKGVNLLIAATGFSPYAGAVVTRVIYFGRYTGILCLFASGLFVVGIQYQKLELFLGGALLLATILAAFIPVDTTRLLSNFVYAVGNAREIRTVTMLFFAAAVFNYVLAAVQNSNGNYLLMGTGVAMIVAGRELLFHRVEPISLTAAFVLLIGGSTLFAERTHSVHLWS